MEPFVFRNPTKLIFGQGQTNELANEMKVHGAKVLLIYGGGSIKRNGLYDRVITQLQEANKQVFELAGVEPNPRLTTVQKGIEICKKEEIDFILAVGGGSVIDATKAISAGAKYDGDIWDIIIKENEAKDALPFGTILTLAATGSEMNSGSVITNWETQQKVGWGSPFVFPTFSILDPVNTVSVPEDQTIYGIVDMMSHVLEAYFHHTRNTPLQDRICESILLTVVEAAPKLLQNLEDLDLRETILYCGTMALNGITQMGLRGDWGSHNIEHAISAVYDIPHAGGLAIIFPHWLKISIDERLERHVQLATRVFGVNPEGKTDKEIALEGIEKLSAFWTSLGAPNRLADYDIDSSNIKKMAAIAGERGAFGNFKSLETKDVEKLLNAAL
ncbi:NADH-dependent butanol dehydrogenase A [Alkalihalobacillus alcalophilus ATCC 27647 = CGMCC 1.3604]|uniref:Butanol dehydrogenase n=1 Tax=Alkalihalobacillus alcalophilus ATCC 27647 = CGMCC 1.3604 TaxID=1218173 RepID=A0A094WII6_ALKAL|nr:iron-containing alcohol dehydrogenase [Alkalihalobacillus alcalophilus]KGA96641.1 butanol dehydrogenase [Alkalihalobacillus alcalophilus ATCC 27647 = CGMCC 1.3604]MED1563629.1 iron-containing alcohol dehydrogenase [Alkalihalobacillus alcalophilus]THG91975.1 NADH-dependent butanol dehydrogenase A [Alkalihalobacillus alcalophilus ATCC 27647 = CGMCC 1.3604]